MKIRRRTRSRENEVIVVVGGGCGDDEIDGRRRPKDEVRLVFSSEKPHRPDNIGGGIPVSLNVVGAVVVGAALARCGETASSLCKPRLATETVLSWASKVGGSM